MTSIYRRIYFVIQIITKHAKHMRSIINISLPASLAEEVKKEVKAGKFASTSEFFRHLWRLWNEEKVYREVEQSRREFAQGKGKILKSLKDLR